MKCDVIYINQMRIQAALQEFIDSHPRVKILALGQSISGVTAIITIIYRD